MTAGRSRVVSEPLGGSPLSQALQHGRLPAELQPWRPSTTDAWRAHSQSVASRIASGWYDALSPAFEAGGAAKQRLERVAREGGVVITTGQQAAIFGGPLYTLAKALTALELADAVERQLGMPVAPVFWAATDDADFLEASVTYAADARGLHELRLTNRPPAGTPASLAPLGDTRALLDALRAACGSAAHADYYDAAREAFSGNRTLGGAYVRLARTLLEPLGIAVMDSSHAAYRSAARPVLLEALHHAAEVSHEAHECAAAIRRAGFAPQVEDDRGLSLVAVIRNGIKRRVPVNEAEQIAEQADAELAPNVLLRPVVECAIVPSITYVGGPAELAYFIQSNAVAATLGRRAVVGAPRWSGTIIEPFADRALRRLGVSYHEVRDAAALEGRLASANLPPAVAAAWTTLKQRLGESIADLGRAVDETALLPRAVIEGLDRSIQFRLRRAERRLLAAVKRREQRIHDDIRVASAAIFPRGERQERVLSYVPMLTRGGPTLVEDLRVAVRAHVASLLGAALPEHAGAR